ncbi:MAG: hypothetical protein ACE5I1_05765, partial [bacterium]
MKTYFYKNKRLINSPFEGGQGSVKYHDNFKIIIISVIFLTLAAILFQSHANLLAQEKGQRAKLDRERAELEKQRDSLDARNLYKKAQELARKDVNAALAAERYA